MDQFDGFAKQVLREWDEEYEQSSSEEPEKQQKVAPAAKNANLTNVSAASSQQDSLPKSTPSKLDKLIVQKQILISKKLLSDPTISEKIKQLCSEMIQEYLTPDTVYAEELSKDGSLLLESQSLVSEQFEKQQQHAFLKQQQQHHQQQQQHADEDMSEDDFDFDFEDEDKAPSFKRDQRRSQLFQQQQQLLKQSFSSQFQNSQDGSSSCSMSSSKEKMSSLPLITKPRIVFEDTDEEDDDNENEPSSSKNLEVDSNASPASSSLRVEVIHDPSQQRQERATIFSSLVSAFKNMYGYVTNLYSNLFSKKQNQQQNAAQEEQAVDEDIHVTNLKDQDSILNVIIGGALFLITGFIFYASVKKFAPDLSNSFVGAISSIFLGGTTRRTRSSFAAPKRL